MSEPVFNEPDEHLNPNPPVVDPKSSNGDSHLFALRTTGGQEKVVLRQLEAKMRSGELDVQSVLIVENLKGYVVIGSK